MTFEFAFVDKIKRDNLLSKGSIPPQDLPDYKKLYTKASLMVWEEHCVECAPPDCYSSCLLYESGVGTDCRRFSYGIYRNREFKGLMGYCAEISFKRWGKLEAVYNISQHPIKVLKLIELLHNALVLAVKNLSYLRFRYFKRHIYPRFKMLQTAFFLRLNKRNNKHNAKTKYPDAFIVDVINMEEVPIDIHIFFGQNVNKFSRSVYEENVRLNPGFNHYTISYEKIALALGDVYNCLVSITMVNDIEATLGFTALDFVTFLEKQKMDGEKHEKDKISTISSKVKCLVWDLDNTLWKGTLIADGPKGVFLKNTAKKTIRLLDERGILQSIASKNNFDDAWKVLKKMKIQDYFLYPQIHWGLKSKSIKSIAKELNIGLNSVAFIDDSQFELYEVSSLLQEVRCYHVEDLERLLTFNEFNVLITPEAKKRRSYYKTTQEFTETEKSWEENRLDFLKSCQMTLKIKRTSKDKIERSYELIQRTNQLNLFARRYSKSEFMELIANDNHECFTLEFHDRFGEYGVIGFSAIELNKPSAKLIELAISCRVAKRYVEQTFISWLFKHYSNIGLNDLIIQMRRTGRNELLMVALEELLPKKKLLQDNIIEWTVLLKTPPRVEDIVKVIV
ncbi:HAD-IIIC family phosphatase [Candidatus Omnitrophota bacterium]